MDCDRSDREKKTDREWLATTLGRPLFDGEFAWFSYTSGYENLVVSNKEFMFRKVTGKESKTFRMHLEDIRSIYLDRNYLNIKLTTKSGEKKKIHLSIFQIHGYEATQLKWGTINKFVGALECALEEGKETKKVVHETALHSLAKWAFWCMLVPFLIIGVFKLL